jgi:uncharacterized peroxidase-related enzyme
MALFSVQFGNYPRTHWVAIWIAKGKGGRMTHIEIVSVPDASGTLRELYDSDLEANGYVPNYTQAMSLRPEVIAVWRQLSKTIRSKMGLRRYELVTYAAAMALRCRYWLLAHGAVLRKSLLSIEQLRAITADYHNAGLEAAEVAMMDYAQKVSLAAYEVAAEDIASLRAHGFTDAEILDIAMAAGARCFFSKTLDAVGAQPDAVYDELAEALADVLPAGRSWTVSDGWTTAK